MSPQVDYERMYAVQDSYGEDLMRLTASGWASSVPLALLLAFARGDDRPRRPVPLEPYMGGEETADWMWGEPSVLIVISDGLRTRLERAGVTGWSTYPVVVEDWEGRRMRDYHGLAITGRAGARDLTRGEVIEKPPVQAGGAPYEVRKGFYFDESKWDGSDLFMLAGSLWMVATERARDVLQAADTPELVLTPLPEVEIDAIL